jgi:hypothetical protein
MLKKETRANNPSLVQEMGFIDEAFGNVNCDNFSVIFN